MANGVSTHGFRETLSLSSGITPCTHTTQGWPNGKFHWRAVERGAVAQRDIPEDLD